MEGKLKDRVTAVVTPILEPGERIEVCSIANVGTVSLKRRAATAAVVGVLSAGTVIASVRPKRFFVALTDRRLLLFEPGLMGRPEKKPRIALPRQRLRAGEPKKGLLTMAIELSIEGEEKALKFVFPLPARPDVPLIAAAVNGTGQAGA